MYVTQPRDYHGKLIRYRKNIHSQNGEDGIIRRLIDLLEIDEPGWCCEFGAWDGKHLSNTYNLIRNYSWNSVLIESDDDKFKSLLKMQSEHDNVIALHETVHYINGKGENLDDILSSTDIPRDFDILSIDVDGPDYHIWKTLENYRPKIVIIEHSGLEEYIIQKEGAKHKKDKYGSTSFQPIRELGESKGYKLMADTGNMIFVDENVL